MIRRKRKENKQQVVNLSNQFSDLLQSVRKLNEQKYLACSLLNLEFSQIELQKVIDMMDAGYSLEKIAWSLQRRTEEVVVLMIDFESNFVKTLN